MKNFLKTLLFLLILECGSQEVILAQTNPGFVGPRANTADDPADGVYVSPTGNDATANGSKDRPYKSIIAALNAAQPGGTIVLRSGTYYEYNMIRIRKPNITIKSAKGEWAKIDLPLDHDPDLTYKQSSTIRFDAYGTGSSGGKLQSIEVIGGFYAVCFDTKWGDWDETVWSGASNIIIEDCILHDSRNDVVKVKPNCNNVTIRYNEIYNSGKGFSNSDCTPDGRGNAEGIDNVNGANMIVQNNHIHDICTNGIYAKGGATDALIENNLIENIFGAGILVGFDTSPEYFDTKVNPDYYENIQGIVRNNLIINTVLSGIGLYAAKDAQVYNNTLINVANGPSHSAIYFGITLQDWESYAGRPASINPIIHHNLVSQPSTITRPMVEIRYDKNNQLGNLSALDGKVTMNDNCYYIAGKSATFNDNRPTAVTNMSLAAWKTHIGSDNGSVEVNPSLNDNYMPANTQCTGMGIQFPINKENPTGTAAPALLTETVASLRDGVLWVESPVAETVQGYSLTGTLLFNLRKPAGKVSYFIDQPKGAMIILKGSSGWTKKIIAQ